MPAKAENMVGNKTSPAHRCTVCCNPSRLERTLADIDLYRCPNCDHCFTDAESLNISEEYCHEYYAEKHRNWFNNPNKALFQLIADQVAGLAPDAAVLDVGCGKGALLSYLRDRNPRLDLTGIDFSENVAATGITFIKDDFLQHDFVRKFDLVTSLAVIEHVVDIHGFVRRLMELCTPEGYIVIMTLNDRGMLYRVARALAHLGYIGPLVRLYERHHVNHFNRSSLRQLTEINGLTVMKSISHNVPLAAVDFGSDSTLAATLMRTGVWVTFMLGSMTGDAYLQTLVCRR
jgi:2-polyprenyl-3-methyl-5-hydroxy-6-metoxy-1,4-benzoquinol methylase